MAYVYIHRKATTNEVFYVGIGVERNHKRAKSSRSRSKFWNHIVNKHGFTHEIYADNVTREDAITFERELIKKYGRIDLGTGCLCNMTDGGDGLLNASEETRANMAIRMRGNSRSKGNVMPEWVKKNISKALSGRKQSEEHIKNRIKNRLGSKLSEETKQKISIARIGTKMPPRSEEYRKAVSARMTGMKMSEDAKRKMSIAKNGKPSPFKGMKSKLSGAKHPMSLGAVLCYDTNGNFIQEFPSSVEAADFCKAPFVNKISAVARGRRSNYKGYVFKFKIDLLQTA